MDNKFEEKFLRLKAMLGDEAAKQAVARAEELEEKADAAGITSKEAKVTTKTNDESEDDAPLSLTALLAELEDGVASGDIVNDLEDGEVEAPVEEKEVDEVALKELQEFIIEVVDARFKEHAVTLKELFVPRNAERDNQVKEVQVKLKETMELADTLKAQLDELTDGQPKRARRGGYRASADADTTVKEGSPNSAPATDPMATFLSEFVLGQ